MSCPVQGREWNVTTCSLSCRFGNGEKLLKRKIVEKPRQSAVLSAVYIITKGSLELTFGDYSQPERRLPVASAPCRSLQRRVGLQSPRQIHNPT